MIEMDRVVTATPFSAQEEVLEHALRPKQFEEYIGQEKIRGQIDLDRTRGGTFPYHDIKLIIF